MRRRDTEDPEGFRIQRRLPIDIHWFGARCETARFTELEGTACVEAAVRLGLARSPYVLHLTLEQALEADIVERV